MHNEYADITSRISEPPKWYDEQAVPRYCTFGPEHAHNIYADEVALVEIACQNCGAHFLVAFSADLFTRMKVADLGEEAKAAPLAYQIRRQFLHYGDPPNAGCCPAGPTMNCEDLRVCEYWRRDGFDWKRDPALEIQLDSIYTPPTEVAP